MSSRIDVDEIRSKTTNGNLTFQPNGTGIFVPKKVPAFYAFNNAAQTLSDSTWTTVSLQDTLFDTCNNFNTSNYRFVAPVNGIYSFTTALNFGTATSSGGYNYARVLKNGSGAYYTFGIRITSAVINNDTQIVGSILLPLNADEYVEMGAYQDVASGSVSLTNGRCYFTGHLVSGT